MQTISIFISVIAVLILCMSLIKVGKYPRVKEKSINTSERPNDFSAIQKLVDTMIQGWNTGNATLYSSAFTDKLSYIAFNGERFTTKEENIEVHNLLFTKFLKGSSLENQKIIDINFITNEVAVVILTGAIKPKHFKKAPKSITSIQTLVAQKNNDSWKFVAFQNSRVEQFSMWDIMKMLVS